MLRHLGRAYRLASVMSKKAPVAPGIYFRVSTSASHQATKEAFDPKSNPWLEKYAAKLEHLKSTQPDIYEERMSKLMESYKKSAEPLNDDSEESEPTADTIALSQTKTKKLKSIMNVELLSEKSAEEIEEIWKEYHSKKDSVFAVIPADHYREMYRKSTEFPNFLYPVPRQSGYEFFVQQFNNNSWYFTTLGAYQTHKENAPQCLALDCYTELQEDKGIVLMRGDLNKNILSVYEAQLVALQVKMYYGVNSGIKFNLVRMFNNSPQDFRYKDLMKEFENYKKDAKEFSEDYKRH